MAILAHLDRIQARYEGRGVLVTGLVDGGARDPQRKG